MRDEPLFTESLPYDSLRSIQRMLEMEKLIDVVFVGEG